MTKSAGAGDQMAAQIPFDAGQPKPGAEALRPVFADAITNLHMSGHTAKMVLSLEVAPGQLEPVQMLVMPTHQLLAFANLLLFAARDPQFETVTRESVLVQREVERLRAQLKSLPEAPGGQDQLTPEGRSAPSAKPKQSKGKPFAE